jgi:hypothetical protein
MGDEIKRTAEKDGDFIVDKAARGFRYPVGVGNVRLQQGSCCFMRITVLQWVNVDGQEC